VGREVRGRCLSHRRGARFLLPLFVLAGVALAPSLKSHGLSGQVSSPEQWVGCWALEHLDEWAPSVGEAGFPTGHAAPAPRMVLLDRLPGRAGLMGRDGPRSFRAEWEDPALRNLEAWALRPDDHVYLEASPGVRSVVLLLEGPPEASIPGRWFFRRSDTPFPEVRALVAADRVACPEGRGPHREESRRDLTEVFQSQGAEGTFVLYDTAGRRLVRVDEARARERFSPGESFAIPAALLALQHQAVGLDETFPWDGMAYDREEWTRDHDLRSAFREAVPWVLEEVASRVPGAAWARELGRYGNRQFTGGTTGFWADGDLRISADEKVAWLADVVRDRSVPPSRRGDGSRIDPVEALAYLLGREDRPDREGIRIHGLSGWAEGSGPPVGWKVGWVEGNGELRLFALNLNPTQGVEVSPDLPRRLALEILEALEMLPGEPDDPAPEPSP
jgi:beta-lactamase class D